MLGNNIVIDVNSGNVHVVDDVVFRILNFVNFENFTDFQNIDSNSIDFLHKRLKTVDKKTLIDALKELALLEANQKIFTKDFIREYSEKSIVSPKVKLRSMCLSISHDCNFRCEYCFAQNGTYGLPERLLMSEETAYNAIDFLVDNSGNAKILEVDFFGGEPLLNYNVVKKTVKFARNLEKSINKLFRFTITTNAFNLDNDEKIEFLNREMHNVVLSLDGRAAVNDRFRKTVSGKPTYDLVASKIKKFIKVRKNKKYCIRGTFTSNNLDFSKDVVFLYEKLGAKNISLEPVICDENLPYAIKKSDLTKVFSEYEKLAKLLFENKNYNDLNFVRYSINLNHRPCSAKILKACSCGNEYVAISPTGDIYPCHQFIGRKNFIIGNLKTGFNDLGILHKFSKTTVLDKEKCRTCWARYYCCGGCNANNHQFNDNILVPHEISCEVEKKRIECAIALQVAKNLSIK